MGDIEEMDDMFEINRDTEEYDLFDDIDCNDSDDCMD